jgi:hypothetical protein
VATQVATSSLILIRSPHFFDLLTSSGFTESQSRLIDEALRETGVQISDMDQVACGPRNRT